MLSQKHLSFLIAFFSFNIKFNYVIKIAETTGLEEMLPSFWKCATQLAGIVHGYTGEQLKARRFLACFGHQPLYLTKEYMISIT